VQDPDPRFRRRYDWTEVQAYYDEGHSISECHARFGFSRKTWHDARLRGDVISRPAGMPLERLLIAGVKRNRLNIRARLIAAGLKEHRCERCGLTEWLGEPIPIELHHINGDGTDHRLENLALLCPTCHAQTDNWGGRGVRRAPVGRWPSQVDGDNRAPPTSTSAHKLPV
jgi:5-methylcytosine-specific restriction endonuclease McrA